MKNNHSNEDIDFKDISKKRIAWLTPVLGVDGDLLYFEPIYTLFSKKYSDFCIFTAEFKQSNNDIKLNIKQCGKFQRLYPNVRHSKKNREKSISGVSIVTPGVILALYRWKPDVIIINEFSLFSLYGVIINFFLRKTKLLFIIEARPRFNKNSFLTKLRTLFRSTLIRSADAIITNNQDGKNYLVSCLGANEKIIIDKPYLISDISKFGTKPELKPYAEKYRDGCVHFLYVGWLVKPKGIHYALQAFSKLHKSLHHKFIFNLVGDGAYKKDLEDLAKNLGIAEQVKFHGMHPYKTLGDFYLASDVFLFPTLNDYRALSPFEALSYGLPILGSIYNGGAKESTIEGKNGFIFDPLDVSLLTEKITYFIQNTDKIDQFSNISKEMSAAYTLENSVNNLHDACSLALFGHSNKQQ